MAKRIIWRRIGLAFSDAILVALSFQLAYLFRYEFGILMERLVRNQYLLFLPVFVAVRLILFASFGLYRGILRYAGLGEMLAIVISTMLGTGVLFLLNFAAPQIQSDWLARHVLMYDTPTGAMVLKPILRSIIFMEMFITILFIAAGRFSRRILVTQFLYPTEDAQFHHKRKRLLIVGAGDTGEAIVRQLQSDSSSRWKPVAFVDDDLNKQNFRIHRIPVAGVIEALPEVLKKYNAEEVLIAVPNLPPMRLREIIDLCQNANIQFRILPSVHDVMTGRVSVNQIRPVEIEDLLGREEVTLHLPQDRNYVRDQVIMITGAGGSIGSELCRQLLRLDPERIVLYGHGENSIYEISQELTSPGPDGAARSVITPVIGDIRDAAKLQSVVDRYKPSIFFHAAAHKHVPLMEAHPDEAIKNNVTGTRNVARIAEESGAKRFILISSDKAVRPTNVMGASKRVAEMIIFTMAKTSRTQFVAVRFGNVLGSRGSVVPLFRRQIARGGPLTLTHPDVVRFFMTIPEAVSLVIQAGSFAEQRRLYLLDMGKPVRILDLAKNLIRLSGFEPDKEIAIKFTGLRPGEKLKEELLTDGEDVKSTGIGKVFCTEPEDMEASVLDQHVARLEQFALANDVDGLREELKTLVPDFGAEKV